MSRLTLFHSLRHSGVDVSSIAAPISLTLEVKNGVKRYHFGRCYYRSSSRGATATSVTVDPTKISATSACTECFDRAFADAKNWDDFKRFAQAIPDDAAKALKLKAPKKENMSRYISLLIQAEKAVSQVSFEKYEIEQLALTWRAGLKATIKSFQSTVSDPNELERINNALFRRSAAFIARPGYSDAQAASFYNVAYAEQYKEYEKTVASAKQWALKTDDAVATSAATVKSLVSTASLRSLNQVWLLPIGVATTDPTANIKSLAHPVWESAVKASATTLVQSWDSKVSKYQNATDEVLVSIANQDLEASGHYPTLLSEKTSLAAVGAYTFHLSPSHTILRTTEGVALALEVLLEGSIRYRSTRIDTAKLKDTDTDEVLSTCMGLFEPGSRGELSKLETAMETARSLV